MKIRTRLLLLILPTVLAVVLSISFLSYYTWYQETLSNFKDSLEAIVVSSAEIIDADGIVWLSHHEKDPNILQNKLYLKYVRALKNVRQKLPVTSIYAIKIEPVRLGEPVLRKSPISKTNRVNEGKDPTLAFRQVYILDTGSLNEEPFHPPGDEDFSESGEIKVYQTKLPFVTQVYKAKSSGMKFMTGFAPILNAHGDVVALVAADLSLEVLDIKAHEAQGFILLGALLTVLLIMIGVAFIANNISQPVEQLKNAALTLAAGNYGKKIEVHGPQEIIELANTLNTMSECLREHLTRLEENSLLREKMIGEVECVRILQAKLVQGVAENFSHPELQLRAISITARAPHKAMVLEILENKQSQVSLRFREANFLGFDGIYELIQGKEATSFVQITLTKELNVWSLDELISDMPLPVIWSAKRSEIITARNGAKLEENDFVIILNTSLDRLIRHEGSIHHSFTRVFRHFAEDGIDAFTTLLANELVFLSQKHELRSPLQAICLQIQKM